MTKLIKHLPPLGIGLFIVLYIYSAGNYPGGSVVDSESIGYDWFHNYWCDLMYRYSLNGEINLARPSAVAGWVILCISILYILIALITKLFRVTSKRRLLYACSFLAMALGLFAFTDNHDLFVMLSFPFGAITVLVLAIEAQSIPNLFIKFGSWLVVISLTASFIMYFTSIGLYWIGFIQKIALAISFLWVIVFYYFVDVKTQS